MKMIYDPDLQDYICCAEKPVFELKASSLRRIFS